MTNKEEILKYLENKYGYLYSRKPHKSAVPSGTKPLLILTPKENELADNELFARVKNGDTVAEQILCKKYLKSVDYYLRMFYRFMIKDIDQENYISKAQETLVNCIRKFEPNKGIKFITYLRNSIRNSITRVNDEVTRKKCGYGLTTSLDDLLEIENGEDLIIGNAFDTEKDSSTIFPKDSKEILKKIKTLLSEKDLEIFKMLSKGKTLIDIAKKYNCTHQNASNMVKMLRNYFNNILKYGKIIKIETHQGKDLSTIARDYNIKESYAKYYLEAYDYIFNNGPHPKAPPRLWYPGKYTIQEKD